MADEQVEENGRHTSRRGGSNLDGDEDEAEDEDDNECEHEDE